MEKEKRNFNKQEKQDKNYYLVISPASKYINDLL